MDKLLTKDEILGALDQDTETVHVPEWGGSVVVRSMTARDRDRFELAVGNAKNLNDSNLRAQIVAASVVDEKGELLFKSPAEVEALGQKFWKALDRVYQVAIRLSKMRPGDTEKIKGNSSAEPSGDSDFGSASRSALSTPTTSGSQAAS